MIDMTDVIQTSEVKGFSKSISSAFLYLDAAKALFIQKETIEVTIIKILITKIHVSSSIWLFSHAVPFVTAKTINDIKATPVTPFFLLRFRSIGF